MNTIYVTVMTVISCEVLYKATTEVRAFSNLHDAKQEHLNNIQKAMDDMEEEEKQFFFNRYGDGSLDHIYHIALSDGTRYVLSLTETTLQHGTHLSTLDDVEAKNP